MSDLVTLYWSTWEVFLIYQCCERPTGGTNSIASVFVKFSTWQKPQNFLFEYRIFYLILNNYPAFFKVLLPKTLKKIPLLRIITQRRPAQKQRGL